MFWASTTDEFLAAVEGYRRANGVDDPDEGPPNTLSMEELEELMERYPDK